MIQSCLVQLSAADGSRQVESPLLYPLSDSLSLFLSMKTELTELTYVYKVAALRQPTQITHRDYAFRKSTERVYITLLD